MRLAIVASWLALTIIGGWLAAVRAAEAPPAAKGTGPLPAGGAAAEIDRLVADLDAPRYSERQSASEKLAALGAAALRLWKRRPRERVWKSPPARSSC